MHALECSNNASNFAILFTFSEDFFVNSLVGSPVFVRQNTVGYGLGDVVLNLPSFPYAAHLS